VRASAAAARRPVRVWSWAVVGIVVAPLLAGCGGSGSGASTASLVPRSGTVEVQALDNRFEAKAIAITSGSTVTWTNDGTNTHDIVAAEGTPFGVKPIDFKPGATYSATFTTPGTYAYYCSLHGSATRGMTATITVVAP
jgi:plastocyanin